MVLWLLCGGWDFRLFWCVPVVHSLRLQCISAGQDIRSQNVTACLAIANIVKSTLGPVGLDKMLVRCVFV